MTILFKPVGEEPEVREIPNELEELQELVGGYVETVPLEEDLIFLVNEEGKLLGLDVLVGDIAVVAYDGGEDFRSLTPEEIEFCKEYMANCEV